MSLDPKPEGTFNNLSLPDHAQAAIKAALNALPVVGGCVASLMESYVPTEAQRSQTLLLQNFKERLEQLEGRTAPIDDEQRKREFFELHRSAMLIAGHSNREEKLFAAANLVANHFLRDTDAEATSFNEKDHFMKCLDDLSAGSLSVLKVAYEISPQTEKPNMASRPVHMGTLYAAVRQFDPTLTLSLVAELRAKNLVHQQEAQIGTVSRENDFVLVTPPGRRFVERFLSKPTQKSPIPTAAVTRE